MRMTLGVYFFAKILFAIIVIVFGLNIFYFSNRDYFFQKRMPAVVEFERKFSLSFGKKEKDYAAFLAEIEKRNIFAVSRAKSTKSSSGIDRKRIKRIVENLELVGIISGNPTKVVIEDKKSGKTFHLGEGESFLEGISVEGIGDGLVELNCYGEIFELYL